jgi:hypothetical protein
MRTSRFPHRILLNLVIAYTPIRPNNILWVVQIMELLIFQLLSASYHIILSGRKFLLNILFSNIANDNQCNIYLKHFSEVFFIEMRWNIMNDR